MATDQYAFYATLAAGISAFAAFATAAISLYTVRQSKDVTELSRQALEENMATTKAQLLLNVLDEYMSIQKTRTRAIVEKSERLAKEYYRELFDLHWTEYQLCKKGYIDHEHVEPWLKLRVDDYTNGIISVENSEGNEDTVSYKKEWENRVSSRYFQETSGYVKFMKLVYSNEVEKALKLLKEGEL